MDGRLALFIQGRWSVKDKALREQLVKLLKARQAHLTSIEVLENIEPDIRTRRVPGMAHSIWDLLEHIRIAQEDILRYTLDPDWISPKFPVGYWPSKTDEISGNMWDQSVAAFRRDLEELSGIAMNPELDLNSKIPHGGDHTYLREILIAADHNAYHLGQIIQLKKYFSR
jgi:hypothetical protein